MSLEKQLAKVAAGLVPEAVRLAVEAVRAIVRGDGEGAARKGREAADRQKFVLERRAMSKVRKS